MKKILMGVAVAAFLVPVSTFAAYMNGGKTVVVSPSQTISDNAYVAGGTVLMSGTVNGDLLIAGGTINLTGKVTNDVMVAGGTIIVNGVTAQDARIVGGNLTIGGTYSGELVAAGGSVNVTQDLHAVKDSYLAGGNVTFSGNEDGSLTIVGGTVYVSGTIGKDVIIKRAQQVTIAAGTVIKGKLEYTAPVEATVESGAQITGGVMFHKSAASEANNNAASAFAGLLTLWWFMKIVMMLAVAFFLWFVWRADVVGITGNITASWKNFGKELLRGFAIFVLLPIGSFVAIFTIIGTIPAIIALLGYVVLMLLAGPVAIIVVSSLIMKRRTNLQWYHLVLGAAVYGVVAFIPVIGWLVVAAIYLASFGALAVALGGRLTHRS